MLVAYLNLYSNCVDIANQRKLLIWTQFLCSDGWTWGGTSNPFVLVRLTGSPVLVTASV